MGRSRASDIRVEDTTVSGAHLAFGHMRGAWFVRDLGSRNGSWLSGVRLNGEWQQLREGDVLKLGTANTTFLVVDLEPPVARATSSTGELVFGKDGVLAIPSEEAPDVLVFYAEDEVLADFGRDTRTIRDQEVLEAAGDRWSVTLPNVVPETEAASSSIDLLMARLTVHYSMDREHVTLEFSDGVGSVRLEGRSFGTSLAQLASRWHQDHESGVPETECGWYYRDELVRDLDISRQKLNLDLFRARRALSAFGVQNAERLIERRPDAGTLRIGVDSVDVRPGGNFQGAPASSETVSE